MMEEFRQPIIDRFTLYLFNNGILADDDFDPVEGRGVYLKKPALHRFFKEYSKRMRQKFTLKNRTVCFRDIIKQQIRKLTDAIIDALPYSPYRIAD